MTNLKKHKEHSEKQSYCSSRVFQMSNERGSIEVEICDDCHYMTARCNHEHNTWRAGGTALICDLCGEDGA